MQTVCIHRSPGDGLFGTRHRRMIELFLHEARPFIHSQPPSGDEKHPRDTPLTPRLRQVLERLLLGDSAKQVAARLGLSAHTVNDRVKELHRHFGVGGRSGLLALFVGH